MTTVMEIRNLTLEYPIPRKYRKEGFTPSGIREISFNVKKGDKVLLPGYGGTPVKVDGVEYILIEEDSILGVIA